MSKHSNLPPAARKQVLEASQQQVAAAAARAGIAPAALTPPAPPPVPGMSIQPVTQFVPGNDPPPPAAPAQPAAAAPPPGATDPALAPAPAPDFKQQYKVLQGKYNSEVARRDAENEALRRQNNELLARITMPAQAAPPAAPAAPEGITPEEIQEYGPELIAVMRRVAAQSAAAAVAGVQSDVNGVRQQVGNAAEQMQRNAQAAVYEALHSYDSDWELVNNSEEFLAWLSQTDVISGLTRKQGLMGAFQNNDAVRVVGIFKAFKAEDSRSGSAARVPQVDPATLIAPGQPAGGAPTAPANNGGKIWSEGEIRDFNHRVRKRQIKPEERALIEADIMAAARDGRIRPDINTAGLANVG